MRAYLVQAARTFVDQDEISISYDRPTQVHALRLASRQGVAGLGQHLRNLQSRPGRHAWQGKLGWLTDHLRSVFLRPNYGHGASMKGLQGFGKDLSRPEGRGLVSTAGDCLRSVWDKICPEGASSTRASVLWGWDASGAVFDLVLNLYGTGSTFWDAEQGKLFRDCPQSFKTDRPRSFAFFLSVLANMPVDGLRTTRTGRSLPGPSKQGSK